MPELPEVETIVRQLRPQLLGQVVKSVGAYQRFLKVYKKGNYTPPRQPIFIGAAVFLRFFASPSPPPKAKPLQFPQKNRAL